MTSTLAAVALAAGSGTRLWPITRELPKVLCPVGEVRLIDRVLRRIAPTGLETAVNVHAHSVLVANHIGRRAHISWERPVALGTAGALAHLRPWLAGRAALAVNADTVCSADLQFVIDAWDGRSPMVAHTGPSFGPGCGVVASITPASVIEHLEARPSGLFESVWSRHWADGTLQTLSVECSLIDCGTPGDLLRANMIASGGANVVCDGGAVDGRAEGSVVFPGAVVHTGEFLQRGFRLASGVTVLVR